MIKLYKMYIKYTPRKKILGGLPTILGLPYILDNPPRPYPLLHLKKTERPRTRQQSRSKRCHQMSNQTHSLRRPHDGEKPTKSTHVHSGFLEIFFQKKQNHPTIKYGQNGGFQGWFFISQSSFGKTCVAKHKR